MSNCAKCGNWVNADENKFAGGRNWHKNCFKCCLCNKMLDSMNYSERQGQIFCKTCEGRKFGPQGVGYQSGSDQQFQYDD